MSLRTTSCIFSPGVSYHSTQLARSQMMLVKRLRKNSDACKRVQGMNAFRVLLYFPFRMRGKQKNVDIARTWQVCLGVGVEFQQGTSEMFANFAYLPSTGNDHSWRSLQYDDTIVSRPVRILQSTQGLFDRAGRATHSICHLHVFGTYEHSIRDQPLQGVYANWYQGGRAAGLAMASELTVL